MRRLPDLLTISRAFFLAPALLYAAFAVEHRLGPIFLWLYVVGFSTDVADGRLARQLGTVNAASAALDSRCDLLFQGAAIVSLMWFRPDVVDFYGWLFIGAVAAQLLQWTLGFVRFGKLVGYHTRWTKIWAVVLFGAIVESCLSRTSIVMLPALVLAICSNLEETAITLLLKDYRPDVSDWRAAFESMSTRRASCEPP